MNIKQRLKNRPAFYNLILRVLNSVNYFNIRFNLTYPKYKLNDTWRKRIEIVKASSDNNKIDYAENAGMIFKNHQVMHNGLKITLGSYYDYGNTMLIEQNKGVHEPQEEYVFQEVLKNIPDGGCMLELGSYWAFYSMWFASSVKNANCFMIEPDPHKMNFGKLNFKLNKLKGTFDLGFIDQHTNLKSSIPFYSVDYLFKKHNLNFIDILHSDIQGFEYKMLLGAEETINANKIRFIFVSTHSNQLHYDCLKYLEEHNFEILCSADLNETFSWDGLLVAQNKSYAGIKPFSISKRKESHL
jgi:hypothetical protein